MKLDLFSNVKIKYSLFNFLIYYCKQIVCYSEYTKNRETRNLVVPGIVFLNWFYKQIVLNTSYNGIQLFLPSNVTDPATLPAHSPSSTTPTSHCDALCAGGAKVRNRNAFTHTDTRTYAWVFVHAARQVSPCVRLRPRSQSCTWRGARTAGHKSLHWHTHSRPTWPTGIVCERSVHHTNTLPLLCAACFIPSACARVRLYYANQALRVVRSVVCSRAASLSRALAHSRTINSSANAKPAYVRMLSAVCCSVDVARPNRLDGTPACVGLISVYSRVSFFPINQIDLEHVMCCWREATALDWRCCW